MGLRDEKVFLARGNARASLGDRAGAMYDYSDAIALNPNNVEAWTGRASARSLDGDAEGAVDDFTQAIELDSTSWKLWFYRGNVRATLKDLPAAVHDFTQALELNPSAYDAQLNRGVMQAAMCIQEGTTNRATLEAAATDIEEAMARAPDYGWPPRDEALAWLQRIRATLDRG
jgi:tetratricopeptide (TPR) repeat protein